MPFCVDKAIFYCYFNNLVTAKHCVQAMAQGGRQLG